MRNITLNLVLLFLQVYRSLAVVFLSVLLSKVENYYPDIYDLSLSVLLAYSLLSLIANFLLLVGIQKVSAASVVGKHEFINLLVVLESPLFPVAVPYFRDN